MTESATGALLAQAVRQIGGEPRLGQIDMAAAIDAGLERGQHTLIQAGTGTGKSLGYLAPLVAHLRAHPDHHGVVATATLALQTQLATKDLPTILTAAGELSYPPLAWSVLKGGSNYVCLMTCRDAPVDPYDQPVLALDPVGGEAEFDADSPLSDQVLGLRRWAEAEAEAGRIADRDAAPRHAPRAWSQVSISGRECVGPACPYVDECFVMAARAEAARSQLVITNHALVAIEASHGWAMLSPDVLVLDEAHELAARVTTAQTDELSPQMVDRAVRLAGSRVGDDLAGDLARVRDAFADAVETAEPGRVRAGVVTDTVADLRAVFRATMTAIGHDAGDARREQVAGAVREVHDIAERVGGIVDHAGTDVAWISVRPAYGPQLVIAPLDVADTIRGAILGHQPTVLTSATLKLGDSFTPLAASVGLVGEEAPAYEAVDVGSPFDYPAQGICYVAADLPAPGRDGTSDAALVELADLMEAADGHTLGLFSSMRGAERAAAFVRERTGRDVLLQGEGHLPDLIARFVEDPACSLFGTISLWQGVDAPGATCHLVVVDRIPFPRPDEPLMAARQEAVSRRGGNGFMDVAARHAGLMLAQGAGRLIRQTTDRGVVAILDSRLVTARYGRFLVASMPPLWLTTDRTTVLAALRRLSTAAS